MCGFLGLVGPSLDTDVFQRALDLIAHRGPDGQGTFHGTGQAQEVLLGHRRLAIIDLTAGGHQPMHSSDGRHTIIFNGEIFNYKELRAELEAVGVSLRSQSDTEVLLEQYVRWGPSIFKRLNGMFALAIYHHDDGRIVLARDHLGIKPLYHALRGDRFVFGSEIKAMLALGVPARLNHAVLGEYLAQMWIMEPDTLFEGVYKLPAGHWATYRDGMLQVERFWDILPGGGRPPEKDLLGHLEWLIADAVRLQLVADVPVGSYVSGGVDSSIITELASRTIPDLIAVSSRFQGADRKTEGIADDGVWAERFVGRHPRMQLHWLGLSPDLFDVYKDLIWNLDEPVADPAIVPAYMLAKMARESGAIVMLSGMGGDELFGGYARYSAVQLLAQSALMPGSARRLILDGAHVLQRLARGPLKRRINHAERFLGSTLDPWPLAYVNLVGHLAPAEIDALMGANDWRGPYVEKLTRLLAGFEDASPLEQAQRIDLKGFLASHNLIYSDKASMAASVEVRVPLLDYRLAELAFALPDGVKVARGTEKVLLKQLCSRLVDPEIAYRKKSGFAMPIQSWLNGSLAEEVKHNLAHGPAAELLQQDVVGELVNAHYDGRQANSYKLWELLTLNLWIERFNVAC